MTMLVLASQLFKNQHHTIVADRDSFQSIAKQPTETIVHNHDNINAPDDADCCNDTPDLRPHIVNADDLLNTENPVYADDPLNTENVVNADDLLNTQNVVNADDLLNT